MLLPRMILTGLAFVLLAGSLPAADAPGGEWQPLFNGKDLAGWDTWLSKPHMEKEVLGLNKDPRKVFTVVNVDGKPAIRISGEVFGALTSKEEYGDFHIRLEFKWGEKKWPPRDKAVRDSGLLYHCVGPIGPGGKPWMQSLECQIQEHDCGDFFSVLGVIADVAGERPGGKGAPIYKKGGMVFTVPGGKEGARAIRSTDYENKLGEWNTIEVLTLGQTSIHLVNGKPNMVLANARRKVDGKEVPLTRGKIQIQSEGAEVFYRNIVIKPLKKISEEYLK